MATYRLTTDPQLYSLSDSLNGIIQYDINLTANAVTQYELSFSFLILIFLSVLSQDDDLIRKACLEKKIFRAFPVVSTSQLVETQAMAACKNIGKMA